MPRPPRFADGVATSVLPIRLHKTLERDVLDDAAREMGKSTAEFLRDCAMPVAREVLAKKKRREQRKARREAAGAKNAKAARKRATAASA